MPVVLVAGTWGQGAGPSDWWRPASVWCANLRNAGLQLLDESEPFEWSTALSVHGGHDPTWRTAGLALKWYCRSRWHELVLVAHSHGGQVAAHALAAGLRARRLVTIGTPVREDMTEVWALAQQHISDDWTHIFTDELIVPFDPDAQPYQLLGSGGAALLRFTREFAQATRNVKIEPATTHHGLVWGPMWNEHDLWRHLRVSP